jgi:potassium channel subfamily K, other eukaryote
MNDPGIDKPVEDAAEDLEKNPYEKEQKLEEQEEMDFLDPRYILCCRDSKHPAPY